MGHGEHRSVTRSTPARIYCSAAGLAITPSLRKLSPARLYARRNQRCTPRHPIIYLDTRDDREEHLLNDVGALLIGAGIVAALFIALMFLSS